MLKKSENEQRANQLLEWYGDGADGSSPTKAQWLHLMERPAEAPVTFVNFFKMRAEAIYADEIESPRSGEEAFAKYADVSVPNLEKVGGKFLLLAPFEANFLGTEEDWDLVVVASYPNGAAALDLYENADYRKAFKHRRAACLNQKVLVCSA
ncbi:MAG: DUF1330 domain-containing protein [Sneathiella sp.]|nr:DUF1330 domain-containing protein [Sneathiella sp.]